MRKRIIVIIAVVALAATFDANAQSSVSQPNPFIVKGFHLDMRIQVMTMDTLKAFALKLSRNGINTLIMEWEGTYPFEKHPLIPNRYAYTKAEIVSFIKYCNGLGIDVIPLQQSFGHVEYILRNERYKGIYIFNRAVSHNASHQRNNHISKAEDEIIRIPGGIPRIVDDKTFGRVQSILKGRKQKETRRNAKQEFLLTGKLFCGICGCRYNGSSHRSGRNKLLQVI